MKRIVSIVLSGVIALGGVGYYEGMETCKGMKDYKGKGNANANVVRAAENNMAVTTFDITPQQLVDDMGVGYNIGNSLDSAKGANASETNWGRPRITKELLDGLKAAGFKTVRIPTTWTYKVGSSPYYTIDSTWMDRVEEVVNYALDDGFYVILNTHHEGEHIIPDNAHKQQCAELIDAVWKQIGNRFKNYGGNLIFEALNEPRVEGGENEWNGGTAEVREVVNYYNQVALNAIRSTGGNNSVRKVMLPTVAAAVAETALNGFVKPNDSNVILSVHAYSPYEFAMQYPGVNTWGSTSDKSGLEWQMKKLYDMFVSKGTPVVIGEFGTTNKGNLDSRITHAEYYVKIARQYGISCVWWDNGTTADREGAECFGIFDRYSYMPLFPNLISRMIASESGTEPIEEVHYSEGNNILGSLSLYNYNNASSYSSDGTISIGSIGTENWQPHVSASNLTIKPGTQYVFKCKLNSSIDRSVTIHFQIPSNNYETLAAKTYSLTAGKTKDVEIMIPAQSETKTGVKCTICLGAIGGTSNLPSHTVKVTDESLRELIEEEETEKEPEPETETETETETATETVGESVQLEINGFQISTLYEGFRTIYSVADPKNEVTERGVIYGLSDYITDADMVVGNSNSDVYYFVGTDNGGISGTYSNVDGAKSYAMTMKNIKTAEFYNAKVAIRVYVKLKDGTYKYTSIERKSVYEIADYLFRNRLMPTEAGHEYLYNEVLKKVNHNY